MTTAIEKKETVDRNRKIVEEALTPSVSIDETIQSILAQTTITETAIDALRKDQDFRVKDVMDRLTTLIQLDKSLGRVSLTVAWEMGCALLWVKHNIKQSDRLKELRDQHRNWKTLVAKGLKLDYRRAARYMQIARVFDKFALLKSFKVDNVSQALTVARIAQPIIGKGKGLSERKDKHSDINEKIKDYKSDPENLREFPDAYDELKGKVKRTTKQPVTPDTVINFAKSIVKNVRRMDLSKMKVTGIQRGQFIHEIDISISTLKELLDTVKSLQTTDEVTDPMDGSAAPPVEDTSAELANV